MGSDFNFLFVSPKQIINLYSLCKKDWTMLLENVQSGNNNNESFLCNKGEKIINLEIMILTIFWSLKRFTQLSDKRYKLIDEHSSNYIIINICGENKINDTLAIKTYR